jgi:hypothetical protein
LEVGGGRLEVGEWRWEVDTIAYQGILPACRNGFR